MDEWVLVLTLEKWEEQDKIGGFQTIKWEILQSCTEVQSVNSSLYPWVSVGFHLKKELHW